MRLSVFLKLTWSCVLKSCLENRFIHLAYVIHYVDRLLRNVYAALSFGEILYGGDIMFSGKLSIMLKLSCVWKEKVHKEEPTHSCRVYLWYILPFLLWNVYMLLCSLINMLWCSCLDVKMYYKDVPQTCICKRCTLNSHLCSCGIIKHVDW